MMIGMYSALLNKKHLRIFVFLALFLLSLFRTASAGWDKKPDFRWQQLYRYDMRENNHSFYINRISSAFTYLGREKKTLLNLEPFFEARHNVDYGIWERYELGAEIGKDIYPFCYIGQAMQQVWAREDYRHYSRNERRDYAESETRLLLSHNLLPNSYIKLKGFVLNEYTYDLRRGAGTRNELAIGVIMPAGKYLRACINWRHVDHIHDFDSDNIEAAATLVF